MTWLISRALMQAYENSRSSPEPAAESSGDISSAGEQSAPSSVMPTPHPFWWRDKTTDFSSRSPFGRTLPVLTADRGEALLTWYRAGFLASISPSPGEVPESTARNPDSGEKWLGSLARFDPASRSWKTAQLSLLGDSDECSVIWPRSGMTAGGRCWALPMSARPISETGCGLSLPTPTSNSYGSCQGGRGGREGQKNRPSLHTMAAKGLWPTPTVCGNYNRKGASATSGDGLATAVKNWPTPKAADYRSGMPERYMGEQSQNGRRSNLNDAAAAFATPTARDWRSGKASQETMDRNSRPLSEQIGGLLNPDWVELLMGWPRGWTSLRPLQSADMRGWGEGWEDGTSRVVESMPARVDRLRCIGNGQVPLCAATAWRIMTEAA